MVEKFTRLPRDEGPPRNILQRPHFYDYSSPRENIMGTEYLDPSYLYLDVGENPLGPPEGYKEKALEIAAMRLEVGTKYSGDTSLAQAKISERFQRELPYVNFGLEGSAGIMHNILTKFIQGRKFYVVGIAPHWPPVVDFVNEHGYKTDRVDEIRAINYHSYSLAPEKTLDQTLETLIDSFETDSRKNIIFYLNNPDTPKGDMANPELVNRFIDLVHRKGWYAIIDEVLADPLPDEDSAIGHVIGEDGDFKNGIFVVRSLSKGAALAGEGVGYMITSPKTGAEYDKVVTPRAIRGVSALTINNLFDLDLEAHYKSTRMKIGEVKPKWIEALSRYSIRTLPTNKYTFILTIDGEKDNFDQKLLNKKILSVPLDKFGSTSSYFSTGKYVRSGLPMKVENNKLVLMEDEREIDEAARAVFFAKVA